MLEVQQLSAGYGSSIVIRDVSLRVAADETLAVIGPNGAGKSTLVKAIVGLAQKVTGTIMIDGQDITRTPTERMGYVGVAYVPQVQNVFPSLTVRENIALMFPRGTASSEISAAIDDVFNLFPALPSLLGRRAALLSGGERQMVAVARAIVRRPKIVLFDEPSAALSPMLVDAMFDAITRIREMQAGIVLVEQNARKALEMSDRAVVMAGGSAVRSGPADDILQDPEIAHLYLGGAVPE